MTWPTAITVSLGMLSITAVIVAALITKSSSFATPVIDEGKILAALTRITEVMTKIDILFDSMNKDVSTSKENSTFIRDKVTSDHEEIKKIGLWISDSNIHLDNLNKTQEAFHKRLDGIYQVQARKTGT